ncbi:MAG: hypothetical protein KatS3mg055_1596 [Chloroflexus sp.]|nr:MAG: hypothetical protein KatS3mg055_1596 [Chloroflexus sp.]
MKRIGRMTTDRTDNYCLKSVSIRHIRTYPCTLHPCALHPCALHPWPFSRLKRPNIDSSALHILHYIRKGHIEKKGNTL